jgi:hypothetical protein
MATSYHWWQRKPLELQIVEACEAIPGLRKLGTNETLDFDYLRIQELANAIREQLLPRGIVMLPNDLECEETVYQTTDGRMTDARVKTEFTFTKGSRSIRLCSFGSARDPNGYAVAIAQTMGLKSLLKRLSLIYGDQDDPEVPRWAQYHGEKKRVMEYQERAYRAAVQNSGRTREQVEAVISEGLGRPVTSDDIIHFPRQSFDVAMKIITKEGDLSEVLKQSVAKARGPQPVTSILDHVPTDEMTGT